MHRPSRVKPVVSIVLATHNRRLVVENTLAQIDRCGLERADYETIVVDNASNDGTAEALVHRVNRLIRLRRNRGSTAKAYGAQAARGEYLLFLDDDSYPRKGSIQAMIQRFDADDDLAAAGFTVHLPSGQREGSALPGVFVGCGVGLRTDAYRAVGGLDRTFFMQAEEYDLCFRLAAAGFGVEVFDDLHVEHLKTGHARRTQRTTFYDVRNNLRVIARYVPGTRSGVLREDCLQRYAWLAEREGASHVRAYRRGRRAGLARAAVERFTHRRRLSESTFERFFAWERIRSHMDDLRGRGIRRVLLADLGKNIFPFHAAAAELGITVTAISDDRFAAPGRTYRGSPLLPVDEALRIPCDGIVVSNTAPVHAARTAASLMLKTRVPVFCWTDKPASAINSPTDSLLTKSRKADLEPVLAGSA